jgi:hypothetical protein
MENDITQSLDIDTEDVLNIETEYYNKGYSDGINESSQNQYIEGREYGYQTGFQRFLVIGYIQGLVEYWQANISKYESRSLLGHLAQLDQLVSSVSFTNSDNDVADYEKNVTKARNKLRVVATIVKEPEKIAKLDELLQEVGGQLVASDDPDNMW